MTVLAIDAGNSRIKWGVCDAEGWLRQSWIATAEAGGLGAALAVAPAPRRAVIANVAGAAVGAAIAAALPPLAAAPLWVAGRARQCGVRSGYAEPERLGADRWAALIGARQLFDGACVVANAGTTLTVDALTRDGVFLGGLIVPGAALMREALARGTAQLGTAEGVFRHFPDNTADAIASGALNALAGSIERMRGFLREAGGEEPLLVLSGGGAAALAPQLNGRMQVVDNLVLEGLRAIAFDTDAAAPGPAGEHNTA